MENKTSNYYNTAKIWQIGLFAFNNMATNIHFFLSFYVSYYAVGIAGLLTAVIGTLLTALRVFDGITDPIIGFFIDRTDTKFGRYRPFMLLGNIILAISALILYNTTHLVPESFRLIYFVLIYSIWVIGYTFQTACTKAGQACLTNDPKQRPIFSMFDGILVMITFTGINIYLSKVLIPYYGGFTLEFFKFVVIEVVISSFILTILAIIGIWEKDRTEYFGLGNSEKVEKVKFRDYIDVIKNNRPMQMLIVSASSDKLAGTIASDSIINVILFGIIMGNYSLLGDMSLYTIIPVLVLQLIMMNLSRHTGMKKVMLWASWAGIVATLMLCLIILKLDVTKINFNLKTLNFVTIAYFTVYVIQKSLANVSGNIVIPMIADCADYETYRSGRYIPGMMGTLFSFIDKLISSFKTTIIGIGLALIGYSNTLPKIGDPLTTTLLVFFIICFIGMPIFGLVCNVIAMKYYNLDKEMMEKIQKEIAEIKNKAK